MKTRVNCAFTTTQKVVDELDEVSSRTGINRSALITLIVNRWMKFNKENFCSLTMELTVDELTEELKDAI